MQCCRVHRKRATCEAQAREQVSPAQMTFLVREVLAFLLGNTDSLERPKGGRRNEFIEAQDSRVRVYVDVDETL